MTNPCSCFIVFSVTDWTKKEKEPTFQIGFRIYRTEEMEELIQWMRSYNETAGDGENLHFYVMDMQWADSSKEYVLRILEQIDSSIGLQYREAFAFLNDDEMYDISSEAFEQGLSVAESLIQEVDSAKENIVEMFGSETFAYARECAQSIYNCCDIRKSDREYNAVQDRHMAEKVKWFIEHGDGSVIFINGHNGHIGKVNCTPNYDCLGRLLAQELGEGYFAKSFLPGMIKRGYGRILNIGSTDSYMPCPYDAVYAAT